MFATCSKQHLKVKNTQRKQSQSFGTSVSPAVRSAKTGLVPRRDLMTVVLQEEENQVEIPHTTGFAGWQAASLLQRSELAAHLLCRAFAERRWFWKEPVRAYAVISKEGGEEPALELTPSVPLGQKQGALELPSSRNRAQQWPYPHGALNGVYICVNEIQGHSLCLSKRYSVFQRDEYHPEEAERQIASSLQNLVGHEHFCRSP